MKDNETGGKGNGAITEKLQDILNTGTFDGVFKDYDVATAIRMLFDPGDPAEINKLLMRSDFPDMQFALAFTHDISMCREYGDDEGEKEMYRVAAILPAVHKEKPYNNRAELVVRGIIGDSGINGKAQTKGFANEFKKRAGLGGDEH